MKTLFVALAMAITQSALAQTQAQTSFEQDFASYCKDTFLTLGEQIENFYAVKNLKRIEAARVIAKSMDRNLNLLQTIRPKANTYKRRERLEKLQSGYEDLRDVFGEIGGRGLTGEFASTLEFVARAESGVLEQKIKTGADQAISACKVN
jgi:hypothetical protein